MQSFSRGWSFLRQAWSMAFKDKDLLKPSVYALLVGAVVSVIGIIPIAIAAFLFGDSQVGNIVLFVLGAILVFVQFVVTYIFSGMTVYLIYGYLTKGDGRMDHAWAIVKRDFFDILTLAAASTAVSLIRSAAQRNRKGGVAASLARSAAGLMETLWTEAAALVLPAMVIDDLNLKDGLQRVWKITKENFLLVGISTIGVRFVTGLIGFIFGVIGFVIAFAVGGGLAYASGGNATVSIVGIIIGALIFFAFVMIASVFSSYTTTAYHTCLYIWAKDVEKATTEGRVASQVQAPAPLAAVLA
ncbi:MAG: glycerophosphoryl diester phosphodiesterase membrane domain-containing protein [Anaerolineales bacterium]|nr:glycerophosphoryl diester phosphodiesterase membrane domain-containing protein [Anaerolineales bacterium]